MQESKKKIWAKLCPLPFLPPILHLPGCPGPNVVAFVEGLHFQGDGNPLQLLSTMVVLEGRAIFILSFAIGHRPGKMSDGTGDFGHFCRQKELIFLPRWRLWERGESFPQQAAKWDHTSET